MANVTNFVYCGNIRTNEETSALDAVNVMSQIVLTNIPENFSFSLMFSIFCENGVSEKNTIRVVFSGKNGDVADTDVVNLPPVNNIKELPLTFTMSWDLRNISFKSEGIYETNVYFDDEQIYSAPILVKVAKGDLNEGE